MEDNNQLPDDIRRKGKRTKETKSSIKPKMSKLTTNSHRNWTSTETELVLNFMKNTILQNKELELIELKYMYYEC